MPLIEHADIGRFAAPCDPAASGPRACIAIPARDEEALIGACLQAFAAQSAAAPFAVLVLANNCTDETAARVRALAPSLPYPLHLIEARYQPGPAPAARARRLSVNAALGLVPADGVVMMTDADSVVSPGWVAGALAEIDDGADAVCGVIAPDLREIASFPEAVLQRGVAEFAFEQIVSEMEALLDPLPWDPWPRHRMETGASLAATAPVLRLVGGVPEVQPAEDRALIAAIRRAGGKIRHTYAASVATSCRIEGRARGGWADDLRARMEDPSVPCHDVLEPACALFRRALIRGALRQSWPHWDAARWAAALRVSPAVIHAALREPVFAAAWAVLEAQSPRLAPRRLAVARLPEETRRAHRLLARARALSSPPVPA